jgi:hypothetical protein
MQVVDFGEPNNTLYIKNLNEKYSRSKVLDELKAVLRKRFSTYGEIVDIVALSNFYSKGQVLLHLECLECSLVASATFMLELAISSQTYRA